ncbi:MAG: DUF2510 domain-containing protein, partial [Acidimicrobiaceae bacterium]|nr:DUF2510 domain-containing protein [Acidimicrobiaceae bacterium]
MPGIGTILAYVGSPPESLPPPGWYLDPNDPRRQRWWDGRVWTSSTTSTEPSWVGVLILGPIAVIAWLFALLWSLALAQGVAATPQPNQTFWVRFSDSLPVAPIVAAAVTAVTTFIVTRRFRWVA